MNMTTGENIIMSCVLVLLVILVIVSYLAPKLEHRRAIKRLIILQQGKKDYKLALDVIDVLSSLHYLKVKESKRGKGWFVEGTRTYYETYYDGERRITYKEYFPVEDGDENEDCDFRLSTICGSLHAPSYYLPSKEAAEKHRESVINKLLKELSEKYAKEVNAMTIWED